MSKIVKSRNLFLEKEELVRWDRFYQDDGLKDFTKRLVKTGGIISGQSGIGNNFLFTQGSSYLKIALTEDSVAYDTQGNRIFYEHQTGYEFGVPFTASAIKDNWVYLEYATSTKEIGTVTLSINGAVTGVNTKFTEVFRGQTTLVPNKIRIYLRESNVLGGDGYTYTLQGTYEVNEVVSDTSIFINASAALSAGTYVYSVVGAFSPGSYDDGREEEIYSYDSFNIVFSDTDPSGTLTGDQYMLCKVTIDDSLNTQTIVDLRYGNYSSGESSIFKLKVDDGWVDISDYISFTITGTGAIFNPSIGDVNLYYKICHNGTIQLKGDLPITYDATEQTITINGEITQIAGKFPKINGVVSRQPIFFLNTEYISTVTTQGTFECIDQVNFEFKIKMEAGSYDINLNFFSILRCEYL